MKKGAWNIQGIITNMDIVVLTEITKKGKGEQIIRGYIHTYRVELLHIKERERC